MIDQYPPSNGVLTSLIWRKTAAGGETSLSGYDNASQALSYTPGQEQVYLNGILLVRGEDYTATNGTSITGLSALTAGDFVQINCYNNFSVASVPTTSLTGTIANNQLANSSITINGSAVSLGGSVSLAGDIESVTASSPLTGGGTSGAVTIGIQSASTTQSGAVQLTDSTSSTSTTTAATPASVKSAYDLANAAIPKNLTTTTGDIIYASAANTPARLGIGSTGQVLTVSGGVPAWSAAAGGGGHTLIETLSLSGSSVTSSTIPGTYKHLFIVVKDVYLSGNENVTLRLNSDSGTKYYGHALEIDNTNITAKNETTTAFFIVDLGNNSGATERGFGTIFIPRYTDTSSVVQIQAMFSGYIVGNKRSKINWGFYDNSAAITTITLNSGGQTFSAGTAYIYGVS